MRGIYILYLGLFFALGMGVAFCIDDSIVLGMSAPPTATVILRWEPCVYPDMSGYRVYSLKAGSYTWMATFAEPSAYQYPADLPTLDAPYLHLHDWISGAATYEVDPRQIVVVISKDTCFIVRAVDQFNHESKDSNIVCATVLPKAEDVYNDPQTPEGCCCPSDDEMAAVMLGETNGQGER